MSTSLKHEQNPKNIAATLVKLRDTQRESPLGIAAASLIQKITENSDIKGDELTVLGKTLIKINEDSFYGSYPHLAEERQEVIEMAPPSLDEAIDTNTIDGALFAYLQFGRYEHGLDEVNHEKFNAEITALQQATKFQLATLTSADIGTPDIKDVSESFTRLRAHGDYLYGMNNGAGTLFEMLTAMGQYDDVTRYGDDILAGILMQVDNSAPTLTIPVGNGHSRMPTFREIRPNSYSISSDIPHARQKDADIVNAALLTALEKVNSTTLDNLQGHPFSEHERARIIHHMTDFVGTHIVHSNNQRFEAFFNTEHLSFEQALQKKNEYYSPSEEIVLATTDYLRFAEPLTDEAILKVHYSDNVQHLHALIKASEGRLMKVDSPESLAVLQRRFPNLSSLTFSTSQAERALLNNYDPLVKAESATSFTLKETVRETFADLGITGDTPRPIEDGPLNVALTQNIRKSLPGIDEEFTDAIATAVKNRNHISNPSYFAENIVRQLPIEYKRNIEKPGELYSVSPELAKRFEHSDEDLPIASPSLKR
jgi:hypothetical protein